MLYTLFRFFLYLIHLSKDNNVFFRNIKRNLFHSLQKIKKCIIFDIRKIHKKLFNQKNKLICNSYSQNFNFEIPIVQVQKPLG